MAQRHYSGWRSSTVDAFASPESSNVVNDFSKFHICDVRCLPNAEFAKCQVFFHPSRPIYLTPEQQRLVANSLHFSLSIARYQASQRPVPSFFAESKISPNAEFAECKISANAEFCCVSSFLSANLSECRVCHMLSFSECSVFPTAEGRVCKSRVLSNTRFCRVTACRRLPAVKS